MCEKCSVYSLTIGETNIVEKGDSKFEVNPISFMPDPEIEASQLTAECAIDRMIDDARMSGSAVVDNPVPCKLCGNKVNCVVFLADE